MTSRIISFLKFFQRGNAAAASGANPNSWATVGLWRRFFELQEKEEQEQYESVVQLLEEIMDVRSIRPIESEQAIQARREMMRDYYRGLRSNNNNMTSSMDSNGNGTGPYNNSNHNNNNNTLNGRSNGNWAASTREENLDIPVGDFHVTLAQ